MNAPSLTRLRQVGASLAGLGAAGVFLSKIHGNEPATAIPSTALAIAAVAAQLPWLGAQLLARGLWWSNLVLGVLFCVLGSHSENSIGIAMTSLCGLALLLADRKALTRAAEGAGFRPAGYLGTLQLMMVLALADAQTLFLFAALGVRDAQRNGVVALLTVCVGLVAGFVGLYRIALWGVFTVMGSALAFAALILAKKVQMDELTVSLLVGCAIQVAVPLPMLGSMALKRPLPSLPARSRGLAASAAVVLIVAASVAYAVFKR